MREFCLLHDAFPKFPTRRREGRTEITSRASRVVALIFGLLHGFGFTGALSGVGFPQNHIPAALFFLNVGVEIQIVFITVVLSLIALVGRYSVACRTGPIRLRSNIAHKALRPRLGL